MEQFTDSTAAELDEDIRKIRANILITLHEIQRQQIKIIDRLKRLSKQDQKRPSIQAFSLLKIAAVSCLQDIIVKNKSRNSLFIRFAN
jgi:hypothetical protein